MKFLSFTVVILSSVTSFATSDLERGLIFIGNSASGGTYLASLESQKAKIMLDYKKQSAEMKVFAEAQHHDELRKIINSQILQLELQMRELSMSLNRAKETQFNLGLINELLGEVYNSKLTFDQLRLQLEERGSVMRSLNNEWQDLLSDRIASYDGSAMTASELNGILLAAMDREAENSYSVQRLVTKIKAVQDQIDAFKSRLGELQ